jgi:hypothetical protein
MSEGMVLAVAVALATVITVICMAGLMAYVRWSERSKEPIHGAPRK